MKFGDVAVNSNATVTVVESGSYVRIGNNHTADRTVTFLIGKTLTKAGDGTLYVDGTLEPRLSGSADVLAALGQTAISHTAGTTDYDSPTIDTANGLWDSTVPADDNDLVFTLANNKGDVTSAGTSPFTGAEDAGYVVLKGLLAGTEYSILLDLAADNTAAVIAELSKNSLWESVVPTSLLGHDVSVSFIAPADGDFYFAWDNVGANALGDDIVAIQYPPPGTVFLIR